MKAAGEEASSTLLYIPQVDFQGLIDMQFVVVEVGSLFE
jgi:hypothetical protein